MRATLIGATGLIGGHLLEMLLQDDYYDSVRILVRRPFEQEHPKLEKKLVDFSDKENFRLALEGSNVIFCAVGTTQKKVKGDKTEYRKIDYDIAVNAAQLGKQCGCETFVLVSAIGANPKSSNFYLKLKGEAEDAVKSAGLESVHIMRPSMLLGNRKEFRLGEKIGTPVMRALSFLLPARYKPVQARDVAMAMKVVAKKHEPGIFIHSYKERKNIHERIYAAHPQ
jgi:uncharacterized protein YbjT (DUF2867 family)